MIDRSTAHDILQRAQVPIGANYYALTSSQVDRLLLEADARKYRKPKNANGSRSRYFHEYLQRRAAKGEK